jgi:hypothetical protein
MEALTIYHKNTGSYTLQIEGGVSAFSKFEQRRELMGEDVVEMSIESAKKIPFAVGDYFTIRNLRYTLNQLPQVNKISSRRFAYEVKFEGLQYQFNRTIYLNVNNAITNNEPLPNYFVGEFSLTGDAMFFMEVLIYNMARINTYDNMVWAIGTTVANTETKTLSFSGETCLAVLQKVCEEYELEYDVEINGNYFLNFYIKGGAGTNKNTTFKYGQGKGLYEIDRANVDDSNVVTALFVLGSTKNLYSNYRGYSPRLKLPGNELSVIIDTNKINLYGYSEGYHMFEDVYPHRTGTVTGLGSAITEFIDSTMGFDLNLMGTNGSVYLIAGAPAKIHFNSGNLAGYEFDLSHYDHATKKFTIAKYTDERGQDFPDAAAAASGYQITTRIY